MAIRVQLNHQTLYSYDRMVVLSPQLIRLKPAAHCPARVEAYSMQVEPATHVLHWQQDVFGNFVARVDFSGMIARLSIQVQLTASLQAINPFDFLIDESALSFPFDYTESLQLDLASYRGSTEQGPYLLQWIGQLRHLPRQDTVVFLTNLNQQIFQAIGYQKRLRAGVQTADETLRRAMGSCRDMAWLLVQLLRKLGLAARFVSGYLVEVAPVLNPSSPDSLALHAWAEVYLPGAGWLGLDPTSGMVATEGHMPLACSPGPAGAAPLTGTVGLAETELTYTSTVVRLP